MCQFCNNIYDFSKPTVVKLTSSKDVFDSKLVEMQNPFSKDNPQHIRPQYPYFCTFLDYEGDMVFLVHEGWASESEQHFQPVNFCPECGHKFELVG